jgi:hypothetical protein
LPAAFFRIILNARRGRMDLWINEIGKAPEPANRQFLLEQAGLDSAAQVQTGEWVVEAAIPLPTVGFPLKEGMTYLGNIIRVRPAGAVREMAWNPAPRELRRSADFGVFKLCGLAPKPRPIQAGDAVSLRNGDRINGSLLRLADGQIQFSSPALAEPVSFSAAEALRLDLAWTEADPAPSRFLLNDGAEIGGRIASLSAEAVGIESPSLGRISIPRGALSIIFFSGSSLESRFETGLLKPWEAIAGDCNISGGVLRLSGPAVLSLPLHQDKTVTLIADYDSSPPFTAVGIQLFADRAHPQMQIHSGVMLNLVPAPFFIVYKDGEPTARSEPRGRIAPVAGRARIRVTYNPADGSAEAWYNDKPAAEMAASDGPKEGEYVVLGAARPLAIRLLAVYCGLPAPDEPIAGPKSGEILACLSNGDTVRASQVEFADGNFVFTTEFGPMKLSPGRVVSIAFPAGPGKPPAAESAAWVETSGSRIALDVQAITDEFVIGRSPDLGDVKLPRRIVKSIAFPAP